METSYELDNGLSAGGGREADSGLVQDPAVFWRWVNTMTRRAQGWALVGLGAVILIVGYTGVARQALIAKQLPYLISGGLGGLALVGLGAMFIVSEDLRHDTRRLTALESRIDRIEDLVSDLHSVLLAAAEATGAPAVAGSKNGAGSNGAAGSANGKTANGNGAGASAATLVALPSGQRFHRPDCSLVEGKAKVARLSAEQVRSQSLSPCLVCDPALVEG